MRTSTFILPFEGGSVDFNLPESPIPMWRVSEEFSIQDAIAEFAGSVERKFPRSFACAFDLELLLVVCAARILE